MTVPSTGARRLRVGVVGLDHYHVTGWVETIEGFPDELEIVALYDPDPEMARTLAPTHHDPSLRPGLGEAYRGLPVETSLDELIERHALDVALVTLPNADAPAAIERLAGAGIHHDHRQAGRPRRRPRRDGRSMPSGPPGSAPWWASRAATRRRLERRTRWSRPDGSGA